MQQHGRIEAELQLSDARVLELSSIYPTSLDHTFYSQTHLFAMYLSDLAKVEGRYFDAKGGSDFAPIGPLFFRPAKMHLNIRGKGHGQKSHAIHCQLDDKRLQALFGADLVWTPETLASALNIRASQYRSHFLRLRHELRKPGFASPVVADAVLVLMLSDLFNYLAPEAAAEGARQNLNEQMMRRIRERVYDVQAVVPTVSELAGLCGVSDRHLLRLFRERDGVSLIEFIRQARLVRAMEYLSATNLPMKEIAFRLGFASNASFTTAFGRETGVAPTEFRRHRRSAHAMAAAGSFG